MNRVVSEGIVSMKVLTKLERSPLVNLIIDGKLYAVKVARTVWSGGKVGD